MRKIASRAYRPLTALSRSPYTPQLVLVLSIAMILAQLCLRAWALYPSWFYTDDYLLLQHAQEGFDVRYLLTPHNGHLMPAGRLVVSLVLTLGGPSWGLAATSTLLFQALASAAALWMLIVLFRARWAVLVPLSVYLFGTLTLPALMWWAAALNQLPMQSGFFVAVAAWVLYLRTSAFRWAVVALLAVLFGLAFDVKSILILPVLVFVMLAYFCEGPLRARARSAISRFWPSAVLFWVSILAYLVYYVTQVDAPFRLVAVDEVLRTTAAMLGIAFTTGAVGGPWSWNSSQAPNVGAAPPATAVHLTWVLLTLVVLYGALLRHRSLRAWGLLIGYLAALLALLIAGRVSVYGAELGLQYRFLTDAACVLTLAVGLAFLPLTGARESSEARADPLLRVRVPHEGVAVLVVLFLTSSVYSSVRYVRYWHDQNPGLAFSRNLQNDLHRVGRVDIAMQKVPEEIIDPLLAPYNDVSRVIPLFPNQARFPSSTDDLWVVDTDGSLRRAVVRPDVVSRPGPQPDCGWRVGPSGRTIPLSSHAHESGWWIRLGYLASSDSPVTISAGDEQVRTRIRTGLHSLFVRIDGSLNSVRISGLSSDVTLCVDTVEVGEAVAGESG